MRVIEMDAKWREHFLAHARASYLEYYWFITDLTYAPDSSKVLLAVEGEDIIGSLLIFEDRIVQGRGRKDAVARLLDTVTVDRPELNLPQGQVSVALERFSVERWEEIMLMYLSKGGERLRPSTMVQDLQPNDAEEVSELLNQADPVWWRDLTSDSIQRSMEKNVWVGIKEEGRLLSVGYSWMTPPASNIGIIATKKDHRNRGLAKAVVSELVRQIFERMDMAVIHVRVSNHPAVQAYTKVGFTPYAHYDMIRTKGRRT